MKYSDAFDFVNSKRTITPNENFIVQLQLFEEMNFTLDGNSWHHLQYKLGYSLRMKHNNQTKNITLDPEILQLSSVSLRGVWVNDNCFELLTSIKSLQSLKLNGSSATDSTCVRVISKLTALNELDISETYITQNGISHLTTLTNLNILNISSTDIKTGLIRLAPLTNLKKLYITDKLQSEIQPLKSLLPNLDVETRQPIYPFT